MHSVSIENFFQPTHNLLRNFHQAAVTQFFFFSCTAWCPSDRIKILSNVKASRVIFSIFCGLLRISELYHNCLHTSAHIKLYIVKNKLYIDGLEKREETLPSRRESEYLGIYSFKENPRLQNFQRIYNTANFYQYLKTLKAFQRVFSKNH